MWNISNYLKKFSQSLESTELQKEKIREIIKNQTEIEIGIEKIEIKNAILNIEASLAQKNKIFMYKSKILEDFLKNGVNITDIR